MKGIDSVRVKQIMADKELAWTTWEELLLTCAVKRHGLKDWDSVAMDLQHRSSLPLLLTAEVCKYKYHELKGRFMVGDDEVDTIPWLEELRKLRVAELKEEVHRYDLSIQTLQLKVKRLQEERERSLKENKTDEEKPDLETNWEERFENGRKDGTGAPEEASSEHAAGKGSDTENRSFNESNSTESRGAAVNEERREPEPVENTNVKPDPVSSDSKLAGEVSYNDSSGTVVKHAAASPSQEKKGGESVDPAEFRNSAGESKEGTKESSDVQSTASLTRTRRQEKEVSGCSKEPAVSPATIKLEAVKSKPLVGVLDIIRSHKHGSVFERRLESQKADVYKNMVRHHVDLETIRTRLDKGSYFSCTSKFYRDLLLLFNNAVVFFPKRSPEAVAAGELRDLISKEMNKKKTQRSDSSPEPARSKPTDLDQRIPDPKRSNSLLANHKSSVPIVVCRKRSSISAKASNTTNKVTEKQTNEKPSLNPNPPVKTSANINNDQSPTKVKMKERAMTGTTSLRRSSKGYKNSTPNKNHQTITNPISNIGSADKGEALKTNKKKADATVKKEALADFLKRIKMNSPTKGKPLNTLKSKGSDANSGGRKEQKKRMDGRKVAPVSKRRTGGSGSGGKGLKELEISSSSKRGVGRPPKKGREAGGTKRRREGGGAVAASKPAKKRSRR